MARINTSKMLSNDGYFSSVDFSSDFSSQTMQVSSLVADQYDYALTDDIVLLNERKSTANLLYDIWEKSPYIKQYAADKGKSIYSAPKIPKEDISKIFYYMKNKLAEVTTLSAYETVLAINEFFDFNYDFIVKKVLSPKLKAEIIEDYYNNGMKERIENSVAEKLF